MAKIKFIHTADLHLDTPFRNLVSVNADLAGRLKDATIRSFENIIDLCISEQVDFLLVSGDIFDSENRSLTAQLVFVRGLQRLSEKGIYTYFICGNHDPLDSWLDNLELPEKVYRFGSSKVEKVIYEKNGNQVAGIYGISYRTSRENRDLAGKYNVTGPSLPFSIALLHGTAGNPGPHQNYAPFTLADIMDKGFDYWALGHIHKAEIIREANPAVVYSGNPQGRDFGETGRRGCYLVELTEGHNPEIRFVPTHSLRFEEVTVDLTGLNKLHELPEKIKNSITQIDNYDERSGYILRVILRGRTPLHATLNDAGELEAFRNDLNETQSDTESFIYIDNILDETQPDIDIDTVKKGKDFTAEVLHTIDGITNPEKFFNGIMEEEKLNFTVKKIVSEYKPDKTLLMEKVKWLLLDQLIKDK